MGNVFEWPATQHYVVTFDRTPVHGRRITFGPPSWRASLPDQRVGGVRHCEWGTREIL
jgi:hypothetical protein